MGEKRHHLVSVRKAKWLLDGKQEGGYTGQAFFCGSQGACSKEFMLSKLQPIHLHTSRREAVVAGVVAGSCSWQLSALTALRQLWAQRLERKFGSFPVLPGQEWHETAENSRYPYLGAGQEHLF